MDNQKSSQYSVAQVPFHTHNRADSPAIPVKNLGIIAGQVRLVSGRATIKNPQIGAGSIVVATSTISDNPSVIQDLGAECFNGYASFIEGSLSSTDLINYIIIINP